MSTISSCAQSEGEYQETESRMRRDWSNKGAEHWAGRNADKHYIPGWLNAPIWAEWLQFCALRGWVFVSEQPHVYADGVMTTHVRQWVKASDVPGVLFFSNNREYSASAAPPWVCGRRARQAKPEVGNG